MTKLMELKAGLSHLPAGPYVAARRRMKEGDAWGLLRRWARVLSFGEPIHKSIIDCSFAERTHRLVQYFMCY